MRYEPSAVIVQLLWGLESSLSNGVTQLLRIANALVVFHLDQAPQFCIAWIGLTTFPRVKGRNNMDKILFWLRGTYGFFVKTF
jgi:hypothetical protein